MVEPREFNVITTKNAETVERLPICVTVTMGKDTIVYRIDETADYLEEIGVPPMLGVGGVEEACKKHGYLIPRTLLEKARGYFRFSDVIGDYGYTIYGIDFEGVEMTVEEVTKTAGNFIGWRYGEIKRKRGMDVSTPYQWERSRLGGAEGEKIWLVPLTFLDDEGRRRDCVGYTALEVRLRRAGEVLNPLTPSVLEYEIQKFLQRFKETGPINLYA